MTPQFVLKVIVAGIFFAGTFGCLSVAGTRGLAFESLQEATDVGTVRPNVEGGDGRGEPELGWAKSQPREERQHPAGDRQR